MMKKTLMFCVTTVIAFETESAMSPGWEGSRHSDNDTQSSIYMVVGHLNKSSISTAYSHATVGHELRKNVKMDVKPGMPYSLKLILVDVKVHSFL